MSQLTKEQIGGLMPEQQQELATMKLRCAAKHEQLLKMAQGSKIHLAVQGVGLMIVFFIAVSSHFTIPLVIGIIVLVGVIYYQIIAMNRRMDALLELYQRENKEAA